MRIRPLIALAASCLAVSPAAAQEAFRVECPAVEGPLVLTGERPVDEGIADRAVRQSWLAEAAFGASDPVVWQDLSILRPAYDGVILTCGVTLSNARLETSVALLRTNCTVDRESMVFLCRGH